MILDEVVKLVGAVGIGAIVTAVGTFIQSSKKNQLDYITRERSEWRKQLKQILVELQDVGSREKAIAKLKNQINPYGKDMDIKKTKPYFMREGHIWDLLALPIESIDYDKLSFYIELLLKYDWERSKQEIKFKPTVLLDWIVTTVLWLTFAYAVYISRGEEWILVIAPITLMLLALQNRITDSLSKNPSKNSMEKLFTFIIFYAVPYCYMAYALTQEHSWKSLNTVLLIGLLAYEIYFLLKFDSIDNDYISKLERSFEEKKQVDKEAIRLKNLINASEHKLYRYERDELTLESLKKKHRKIKKKLIKKKRPRNYCLHPIQFCKYLKNRSRISKIIKRYVKKKEKN